MSEDNQSEEQHTERNYEKDITDWLASARELYQSDKETLEDGRSPKEVAEQYVERALRYNPLHQEALIFLIEIYIHSARGPLLSKRLNRLLRDYPEDIVPYRALLAFMRASGKIDMAVQYFRNLLEQSADSVKPVIHLCLAELFVVQNNQQALRMECQKLATFPPIEPITQGLLLLEYNDASGIFALADKIEDEPIKHTLWGMVMEAQGDFEKAGQYFFSAGSVANPPWYALNALANMWLNNKNIEYASAYLEQVEAVNPNAPEVLLTKGRLYQLKGLPEKAHEIKERLVASRTAFSRIKKQARVYLP